MPSFLSICLTILRIAIQTTNLVQGWLIELHNVVEWLIENRNSSITLAAEDHSSNQSLAEKSSSEMVNADQVASSRSSAESEALQSARSSDIPEFSSTRKVFARLNRQSTLCDSENTSEPVFISVRNKSTDERESSLDSEDQSKTCSTTNDSNTTKDDHSPKFQEHDAMLICFRDEPDNSKSTSNEDGSVPDEPTEVMPLDLSQNSENAGENSDVEEPSDEPDACPSPKQVETPSEEWTTNEDGSVPDEPTEVMPLDLSQNSENAGENSDVEEPSDEPAACPSPKQVETPSEEWKSSLYSASSLRDSPICVSSKEGALGVTALSEGIVCQPRLVSKKCAFDMDLKFERNLHLKDYDTSTLKEKRSKVKKSPVRDSSIQMSVDKRDINLKETHSPVKPSPSKKSGKSPVKTKDDKSKIPHVAAALDLSLSLPRFCVDHSTGNVQWKTNIPSDKNSESNKPVPHKKDDEQRNESDNEQGFDYEQTAATGLDTLREFQIDITEPRFRKLSIETSTSGEEIQYKPIRDRVPTPLSKFSIAESSTDTEKPEDAGASAAQSEFKAISERRPTPAARFPTRPSTDTDEDSGAKYDSMLTSRRDSSTIAGLEFKSIRERRPTPPPPRFVHHQLTSSSGTESGIFSEPNNPTIFVPLREESRPPALRSPLKSRDNSQNVRFIDQPLLTKNDRIDSMEKIEFVIKPTCEFIPLDAIIFPPVVSQLSTPLSTDSETPENIQYLEKTSQLLLTVSNLCYKEQEFCDINSSATEFPASGSPTNTTDSEEALKSENTPQILVKSPSSTENDKIPPKELKTPSVRFQLPEFHVERESKGIRRESKFRKPPNETSTSEEENDANLSKKRRASPGKFYKSPKKFAEATASKTRGHKFSPQKTSDEKKREDKRSCEDTSATRSLDFELGIQRKSGSAANLQTTADQKILKPVSKEHICPRIFEDKIIEKANLQQATSKSESVNDTSSTTDSTSETTSSARISDYLVEDSAPEGTEGLFSQFRADDPLAVAGSMVNSDEQGSDSAPEGTRGLFPRFANETLDIQENVVYRDSEADSTTKNDAANDSSVKDSTDSDTKSRKMSTTGNLDDNKASYQSTTLQDDKIASIKSSERGIGEGKKIPQLESTSNLHALSDDELKSSLQLEATDSSSNDDGSKSSTSSESSSSEESIDEKSGSDSSNEGAAGLSSQPENITEIEKSSNIDKKEDKKGTENKSESSKFATNDESTNKEFVKDSHETNTDELIVPIAHQVNVDSRVEIDTSDNDQRKTSAEVGEHTESREAPNSPHAATVLSESQISENERPLDTELSSLNEASALSNRISVLSPVYEVSANGTASSCSYSESEVAYVMSIPSSSSEDEGEFILEQESSLSESSLGLSPTNVHSSSEPEIMAFSMSVQGSSSNGKNIQLATLSSEAAVQSPSIDKETRDFNSETETVSSLSSPSKSSNSEIDEESTLINVAEGTLETLLSCLNTKAKNDHTSQSYFSPVLKELVQRMKSTTGSSENETISSPRMPSNNKVDDAAEVTSDPQLCPAFKTNVKKAYNIKSCFNPVLKELVQRVKSNTGGYYFPSISNVTTDESLSADSSNDHTSEDLNRTLINPENIDANNDLDFLKHTEVNATQTRISETENVVTQLVCVAESIENFEPETLEISRDLSTENAYFEVQNSTEMHQNASEVPLDHSCAVLNKNVTGNQDASNLIASEVSKSHFYTKMLVSDSSEPLTSETVKVEDSDTDIKTSESSEFLICSTSTSGNYDADSYSEPNNLTNSESSVKDAIREFKCEDERETTSPKSMIVNLTSVEPSRKQNLDSDKNPESSNNEVLNYAHDYLHGSDARKSFSERSVCDNITGGIIENDNNSVPKIEVPSETSVQTSPRKDFIVVKNSFDPEFSNDSIENKKETDIKNCANTWHSDNLIADAENIEQDYIEFELQIAPQPVTCEFAMRSVVEYLVPNEPSADQNEIRIVDSKTSGNELNGLDIGTAECTIYQPTSNADADDYSHSRCAAVCNNSTTVVMSPSTENLNSSRFSSLEALVEVTKDDYLANALVEMAKDNFSESTLVEVTKDDRTENIHVETNDSDYTENSLVEVVTAESIENTLVETVKEDVAENSLAEVSVDDPTENASVEVAKGYSAENTSVDVLLRYSAECNKEVNTSANFDSSLPAEVNTDKEESSKENKPWKKKSRKSKNKRKN